MGSDFWFKCTPLLNWMFHWHKKLNVVFSTDWMLSSTRLHLKTKSHKNALLQQVWHMHGYWMWITPLHCLLSDTYSHCIVLSAEADWPPVTCHRRWQNPLQVMFRSWSTIWKVSRWRTKTRCLTLQLNMWPMLPQRNLAWHKVTMIKWKGPLIVAGAK